MDMGAVIKKSIDTLILAYTLYKLGKQSEEFNRLCKITNFYMTAVTMEMVRQFHPHLLNNQWQTYTSMFRDNRYSRDPSSVWKIDSLI